MSTLAVNSKKANVTSISLLSSWSRGTWPGAIGQSGWPIPSKSAFRWGGEGRRFSACILGISLVQSLETGWLEGGA